MSAPMVCANAVMRACSVMFTPSLRCSQRRSRVVQLPSPATRSLRALAAAAPMLARACACCGLVSVCAASKRTQSP